MLEPRFLTLRVLQLMLLRSILSQAHFFLSIIYGNAFLMREYGTKLLLLVEQK